MIKRMSVRGVRSFCSQVDFGNFSPLNLFIGQNGTGKTDALFLLSKFPLEESGDNEAINLESNELHEHDSFLEIETDVKTFHYQLEDFWSSDNNFPVHYFEPHVSHEEFIAQLSDLNRDDCHLLQFIVNYVLGVDENRGYRFSRRGFYRQKDPKATYNTTTDRAMLPSSAYNLAKIFTGFLAAKKPQIAMFDEPEVHLEPRAIRRFLNIICWLVQKSNPVNEPTQADPRGTSDVEKHFANSRFVKASNNLDSIDLKQVFVASHSSVFINCFLQLGEFASVYEFTMGRNRFDANPYSHDKIEHKYGAYRTSASVRKVSDSAHSILDQLGCSGADLLQCKGVVWVEGPSDAIYLEKWLEMFARESSKPILRKHVDFEFQMTGGTNLRYHFLQNAEDQNDAVKKLFSMLSVSRNAYVIIDSDVIVDNDGSTKDQSNFEKAKKHIEAEQKALSKQEYNMGIWYAKGNTERRTLENYLDLASAEISNKSDSKVVAAAKVVVAWNASKKLIEFGSELKSEICKLYTAIESWR